jgi:hypothetical protein
MKAAASAMAALIPHCAELQQQQHTAAALDICIQHHLAAEDIVRLWCSSIMMQQLCSARISRALLVRSVEAAAADAAGPAAAPAAGGEQCNSVAALRWLLRQPGMITSDINQAAQQLLAIRCVPLPAAEALVAAGLRMQITGQQLVDAAYSCVEGLEVWVAAFDSAGVPQQEWAADLPQEMQHVCCCRKVPTTQVRALVAGSAPATL